MNDEEAARLRSESYKKHLLENNNPPNNFVPIAQGMNVGQPQNDMVYLGMPMNIQPIPQYHELDGITFGKSPVYIACTICHKAGRTVVSSKMGRTGCCCVALCFITGLWFCCVIPCCNDDCFKWIHRCGYCMSVVKVVESKYDKNN